MKICQVVEIKPDPSLPEGFWQISYGNKNLELFALMAFRAVSFEDAKQKFFEYTKGQFDGYDWPVVN